MTLELYGSVGSRGKNRSADVLAVKERLDLLGFGFFGPGHVADQGLIYAIKLFQSIIHSRHRLGGDGRVDVDGPTHRFLRATNAPQWQTMPLGGPGFDNFEARDTKDHHDFGTNWLADTLRAAARQYDTDYLREHSDAAPLTINDVSLPAGGDTPHHAGHETGMACDLRLPRLDGGTGGIGNANTNSHFDRAAMQAQLDALVKQPLVKRILFNDKALIKKKRCRHAPHHNNHVHVEIVAPEPKEPERKVESTSE